MRSKQTTTPILCQTQGQARLSVAYRATARNVHASDRQNNKLEFFLLVVRVVFLVLLTRSPLTKKIEQTSAQSIM